VLSRTQFAQLSDGYYVMEDAADYCYLNGDLKASLHHCESDTSNKP